MVFWTASGVGTDLNGSLEQPFMLMVPRDLKMIPDLLNSTLADTLLTAMNNRLNFIQDVVPEPHPCSLRTSLIKYEDMDDDYNDLINCCQRHVCSVNGYCKSKKAK